MSEPTYRIDLTYGDGIVLTEKPWTAYVTRLSDNRLLIARAGETQEAAVNAARAWLGSGLVEDFKPARLYATEDGALCKPPATPEPQSLRA